MTTTAALAAALIFLWLGMVLAISFIEAPLKFRAPGVTLPIGLGIGRLVFRALNGVEVVLAVVVAVALVVTGPGPTVLVAFAVAVLALTGQLVAVRPALTRRSDAVLAAGPDAETLPRSQAHFVYVGLESVKVIALIAAGTVLLAG
ncbi:hypothetical protein [Mycolicibacterium diernhoferi]|uniref:DUF4149 domain-containing protein n=1 Tax=Mycolicibacterium diernhoferi TaxID=1801 RepID=A0A1Q4H758_9MYCO|nr:hypothetical protein [Mycolicibacterium diernhoferi]OJZ63384.1 hypothetical protein BRW64_22505 [Mycolicibacterium diernhoferi]OPE47866.1 hypothetical protein BV510_24385 [Mycolicibacterium diernhoferi]PEG54036.1 hypothetical protein CRI78_13185 [Mycolicibacterium diernhoferi]QYL20524.1 hypothetical protein K0O62_15615 [Mycolicibacterium diernhoferi]